jgi:phosphatidylglycerol---prolipoprotein diacylglyceryl transferase
VYPRVELGPLTIYTYGLMVAVGLAVAIGLLCIGLRRKGIDPAHGLWMSLVVIPAGVVGAKLLFLLEEWDRFVSEPLRMAFAGGGLSFYGGLLLGLMAMGTYLRVNRIAFLVFADAAAPGALLGRGLARIGCHLAGDGDYGVPTALPWGTDYSHGIYPPSHAAARLPELARLFPDGVVPDDLPMHPTGIYEFLISAVLFAVLWRYRARIRPAGRMFLLYLLATGGTRFGLEFLALAPPLALGLTEAQLISLGLIAIGAVGLTYSRCANDVPRGDNPNTMRTLS